MLGENQIKILRELQTSSHWSEKNNWTGLPLKNAKRSIKSLFDKGYLECETFLTESRYILAIGWRDEFFREMGAHFDNIFPPFLLNEEENEKPSEGLSYTQLLERLEKGVTATCWNVFGYSPRYYVTDLGVVVIDGKLYSIDASHDYQCINEVPAISNYYDIDRYFLEEDAARNYKTFLESGSTANLKKKERLKEKIKRLTKKLEAMH